MLLARIMHHEAQAMLHVLLWHAWPNDKLMWHFSSNWIHIVKSRYRAVMNFIQHKPSARNSSNISKWTSVLDIHLLASCANNYCIWRSSQHILPTGEEPHEEGSVWNDLIFIQGHSVDDDRHALFAYMFAKKVWQ